MPLDKETIANLRRITEKCKATIRAIEKTKQWRTKEDQLNDFEYLIHHVEVDDDGEEALHHCFLFDHIANLYRQEHLVVKDGTPLLNGKKVKDGTYHIIADLEETQEILWSDEEAEENGVKPKYLKAGMTAKEKAKIW